MMQLPRYRDAVELTEPSWRITRKMLTRTVSLSPFFLFSPYLGAEYVRANAPTGGLDSKGKIGNAEILA